MRDKPFSAACERNKVPILRYLRQWLQPGDQVLEIGSGTGQHGVYFAAELPHIHWQCTDRRDNIAGLQQWIDEVQLKNVNEPQIIDVNQYQWGAVQYDAVFSANTLHIMSWLTVENFLRQVHLALRPGGKLILYGPFRYQGQYTSESNAEFDRYLQACEPQQGIRDIDAIQAILQDSGFTLVENQSLPANNQLLLWKLG